MTTIPCPRCHGTGKGGSAYVHHTTGGYVTNLPCSFCLGAKKLDAETAPKDDLSGMARIIANTSADEIDSMVEAEEKSCATCGHASDGECFLLSAAGDACRNDGEYPMWESVAEERPTCEAKFPSHNYRCPDPELCPTCNGSGEYHSANSLWTCPDCGGTGRK